MTALAQAPALLRSTDGSSGSRLVALTVMLLIGVAIGWGLGEWFRSPVEHENNPSPGGDTSVVPVPEFSSAPFLEQGSTMPASQAAPVEPIVLRSEEDAAKALEQRRRVQVFSDLDSVGRRLRGRARGIFNNLVGSLKHWFEFGQRDEGMRLEGDFMCNLFYTGARGDSAGEAFKAIFDGMRCEPLADARVRELQTLCDDYTETIRSEAADIDRMFGVTEDTLPEDLSGPREERMDRFEKHFPLFLDDMKYVLPPEHYGAFVRLLEAGRLKIDGELAK